MVKPIRNEPNAFASSANQATHKGSKTSYESTTTKVQANAGKMAVSSSKASMKEHKVTPQKAGGENLASLVTKGSGKQRAQVVANLAAPLLNNKPSLANVKKIRSAHIAKPTQKMGDAAKKILGTSS